MNVTAIDQQLVKIKDERIEIQREMRELKAAERAKRRAEKKRQAKRDAANTRAYKMACERAYCLIRRLEDHAKQNSNHPFFYRDPTYAANYSDGTRELILDEKRKISLVHLHPHYDYHLIWEDSTATVALLEAVNRHNPTRSPEFTYFAIGIVDDSNDPDECGCATVPMPECARELIFRFVQSASRS